MNFNPLRRLNEVSPHLKLPEDIELKLHRMLKQEIVKKNEILLEEGEICDRIWFIETGLFRSFKKVKGREEITWFMTDNDLMTDPQSFKRGQRSKHTIQALKGSIIYSISKKELINLQLGSLDFANIVIELIWEYYLKFIDYWDDLTSGTIKHRYTMFLKYFPGLEDVPVEHIASFLKCSERSIYRITQVKN